MVAASARARYREATDGWLPAFLPVLMVTLRAIWGIAVPASRKARTWLRRKLTTSEIKVRPRTDVSAVLSGMRNVRTSAMGVRTLSGEG